MKITITYRDSGQISESEWKTFTSVIHVPSNILVSTIPELLIQNGWSKDWKNIDIEIHFVKE